MTETAAPRVANGRPPTVLHVFATLERGGAELRTLEMLQRQPGAPRQHVLIVSGRRGELAADFEAAGASVFPLDARSPAFPARLRALLIHEGVTVVHAHISLYSGYVLSLAQLSGVPGRVIHLRSDDPGFGPGWGQWLQAAVLRRLADRSATVVVGVSPSALTGSWGRHWRSDPRCRVLISGVDLDRLAEGLDHAPALRQELGLAPGCRVVLHVGRDVATKNRSRALEVFAGLPSSRPSALVFVGRDDPEQRRRLECRAQALGVLPRVRFLGERQDVAGLLATADLLLVTSTLEGLPGVVLEASAVGTPVLASELGGTRYLADKLSGIDTLSLDDPDTTWVQRAACLLQQGVTPVARRQRIAAMRGGPFDIAHASAAYGAVWAAVVGDQLATAGVTETSIST